MNKRGLYMKKRTIAKWMVVVTTVGLMLGVMPTASAGNARQVMGIVYPSGDNLAQLCYDSDCVQGSMLHIHKVGDPQAEVLRYPPAWGDLDARFDYDDTLDYFWADVGSHWLWDESTELLAITEVTAGLTDGVATYIGVSHKTLNYDSGDIYMPDTVLQRVPRPELADMNHRFIKLEWSMFQGMDDDVIGYMVYHSTDGVKYDPLTKIDTDSINGMSDNKVIFGKSRILFKHTHLLAGTWNSYKISVVFRDGIESEVTSQASERVFFQGRGDPLKFPDDAKLPGRKTKRTTDAVWLAKSYRQMRMTDMWYAGAYTVSPSLNNNYQMGASAMTGTSALSMQRLI